MRMRTLRMVLAFMLQGDTGNVAPDSLISILQELPLPGWTGEVRK
mgnify:CR=1 FL=1